MKKLVLLFSTIVSIYAKPTELATLRANALNFNDAQLITAAKKLGLEPIASTKAKQLEQIKSHVKNYANYKNTDSRISLGKQLYFDPRLSRSGLISCNTCHNLGLGGTDGVMMSVGHKWRANPSHLNAPTVFNAVFNERQFYSGESASLQEQALSPLLSPNEMASDKAQLVALLNSIPEYKQAFQKAFKAPASAELAAAALEIFERTLITPAPIDRFLQGDTKALTNEQKQGFKLFIHKGCIMCHTGINFGGSLKHFGFTRYQYTDYDDFGADAKRLIKVPTLRNITRTAPYFHNGSVWTLTEAIESMGRIQLGIALNNDEIKHIIAFLHSLDGDLPTITYPQLPASSDDSPRPKLDL